MCHYEFSFVVIISGSSVFPGSCFDHLPFFIMEFRSSRILSKAKCNFILPLVPLFTFFKELHGDVVHIPYCSNI